MKKYLISLTTLCLALMMGISSVSAFVPPGLAKKGGLPPGIQKRFIQDIKDLVDIRDIIEIKDIKDLQNFIDLLEKKGIKDIKDLIDIIENKNTKEYHTTIKDIDVKERRIDIEDKTALLNLLVSKKAEIELNEKTVKFEDLRKKDEVVIKLDKDNIVTEIKATRKKEVEYTVKGKFLLISEDDNKIYIYEDTKLGSYELEDDVVVRINGEKVRIDKLTQGMELKLTIEDEKVKLIEASKDEETTRLQGKVLAKDDGSKPLVVIQIDNEIKVFYVEKNVDTSEVKVGKEAVIYVKNNVVTSIRMK